MKFLLRLYVRFMSLDRYLHHFHLAIKHSYDLMRRLQLRYYAGIDSPRDYLQLYAKLLRQMLLQGYPLNTLKDETLYTPEKDGSGGFAKIVFRLVPLLYKWSRCKGIRFDFTTRDTLFIRLPTLLNVDLCLIYSKDTPGTFNLFMLGELLQEFESPTSSDGDKVITKLYLEIRDLYRANYPLPKAS